MNNNLKIAKELLKVAKELLGFAPSLSHMKIYELAKLIREDWKNVKYSAKPYLDAMMSLTDITDKYGFDDGRGIVAYFLSNSGSWRGETAKEIKAELKKRLKR